MSAATVRGMRVNYEIVGEGPTVVLLHGWGGCIAAMSPIREQLRSDYRVVSLDLPGFGESEKPPAVWGSPEYAEFVGELFDQLELGRVDAIVGHSFGGKVAILHSIAHPEAVGSLVLVGAPGVRLPLSPEAQKRIAKVKRQRALAKYLPAPMREKLNAKLNKMGSEDYRNAGEMRPILVKVVNEDLRDELPKVSRPTLLVWGRNDDAAPLAIGEQMEQLIAGSGLVVLDGSGHFPYLDEPGRFTAVLRSFLQSMTGGAS